MERKLCRFGTVKSNVWWTICFRQVQPAEHSMQAAVSPNVHFSSVWARSDIDLLARTFGFANRLSK